MSYFDFEQLELETPKAKRGAKPKYNFDQMAVGETKKMPDDVKISSMRVLLSTTGKDLGMRFSLNGNSRIITRIA